MPRQETKAAFGPTSSCCVAASGRAQLRARSTLRCRSFRASTFTSSPIAIEGVHRDLPVLRDPDGYIYFKEEVGGLLMGGFEPNATPWMQSASHRGGIPENFEFQLLPDNWDAFQILLDNAMIRVPALETAQRQAVLQRPRVVHGR